MVAQDKPSVKPLIMTLGLSAANALSRVVSVLGCIIARAELGKRFKRLKGSSLQSMWLVNPTQKYLTPSEQFLGIIGLCL